MIYDIIIYFYEGTRHISLDTHQLQFSMRLVFFFSSTDVILFRRICSGMDAVLFSMTIIVKYQVICALIVVKI